MSDLEVLDYLLAMPNIREFRLYNMGGNSCRMYNEDLMKEDYMPQYKPLIIGEKQVIQKWYQHLVPIPLFMHEQAINLLYAHTASSEITRSCFFPEQTIVHHITPRIVKSVRRQKYIQTLFGSV